MVIEIPLSKTSKKIAGQFFAVVDDEDEDLANFNWYYHKDVKGGYARYKNEQKKQILMHRLIFERMQNGIPLERNQEVDHWDGNKLNNTRKNLRLADRSKNTSNTGLRINNSSGVLGVYLIKSTKRWRAVVTLNRKRHHIGYFDTKEEAKVARDIAALHYHGDFANDGTGNIMLKKGT